MNAILGADRCQAWQCPRQNIGPILMTPDAKTRVFGYDRMLADLYLVEGLK
jgi:hypothetical protein